MTDWVNVSQTGARGGASSTRQGPGGILEDGRELDVVAADLGEAVGIEGKADIIADLEQALAKV